VSGQARDGCAGPLQGRGLLARHRPKGLGGAQASAASPTRTSAQRPALIRPDPAPEPVAQGIWSWSAALRAGELADGGLGTFAAVDWCRAAKKNASRLPVRSRSIESMTWNRLPGTRLMISRGSGAAGDDPGQQRHPRYAHERGEDADLTRQLERGGTRPREFAASRSLMTALDECYSGSPCPHFSSSARSPSGPIADTEVRYHDPSASGLPHMR